MARRRRLDTSSAAAARTTLGELRLRFESARDRLRAIPDELARELDTIARNHDLPERGKEERSRRARARAAREVEELIAEGRQVLEEGAARTQAMRVGRQVRAAERERVRGLLEGGTTPGEIFERAVRLRSPESLAALRSELVWRGDAGEPEVVELAGELDRALAQISSGDEQARNTAAVNLREAAAGWPELTALAAKAVSGSGPTMPATAHERIRLGLAEGADVS